MFGVIDVGGGTRGAYGAGVFDYFLDNGIDFDYCIGVSAGSANCASYLGGQRSRNYRFYTDYGFRKEYMGFGNLIKTGSYINFRYIYGTLSNSDGEDPLDYDKILDNKAIYKIVATDAESGEAVYFDKTHGMSSDNYLALMASCCVPLANKPVVINNHKYFDGGVADPVPIDKAIEDGCTKLVIILTKPVTMGDNVKRNARAARLLKWKYPNAAAALKSRSELYSQSLKKALQFEKEGKAVVIAPSDISGMGTLTKDLASIKKLYESGMKDADKIMRLL